MDDSNAVKLFVGNLDAETTQDDLIAIFSPYGEVVTITVLRQFAFVHLQGEGAADRAIRDLNGLDYRGKNLVVEESKGRPLNSTKVYVGNLCASCSVENLFDLFSGYGKVLDCDKVKTKPSSIVGYSFVYMERKEDAELAIGGLHGTSFLGRPLSVELSKVQQTTNKVPCASCGVHGHFAGECPINRPPMEHHQSQSAVLAAAVAAAAGLPIQVQQSVHNSFYNTASSDPTFAALKDMTTSRYDGKPVSAAIYGALASQVYSSVTDEVLGTPKNRHSEAYPTEGEAAAYGTTGGTELDPQALFEAARARFFEKGQRVLAEQQAVTKSDRDRSPIRRTAPLLPDPVPQPFSQARPKRRALLPTPPGGPELPAVKNGDPIARCYAEYYQQYQQYQHYQQYQQYQHYQPYQYSYPPPPPPPQMPMVSPGTVDAHQMAAPGTAPSPRVMPLRQSSVFHSKEIWWGTHTKLT
ncbi:RNA-binding protein 14a isoform X2 [Triplophysa dalaica]|uniref:RNA-binding protein 14a isoform X2 n=1 Tax=Triplophysa dalaica TaxID=1582913 RepID=UPI0024DFD2D6|nr:RNA-binding protein 14a isoform X2 [Triplophysa dalaica]